MDLKKIKKIAIVGATINREKFGNIVLRDLLKKGFEVIPVTPKYDEVEGLKVIKTIENLPKDTDLLVFIVPPHIGLENTKLAIKSGFKRLWYQPGAFSEEIEKFLKDYEIEYIAGKCIMVETGGVSV
ncbi:CoA-binding protein [Thermosipho ferrireducens]|uniref:CoA-binding protein n=1 Tax=Thermosipho ferrireducens TaxID=2571116 RepID=A0ABX7SAJ0_9BACT|nr:CoA-binding protein [Thermosipho ferrireducens]QTA38446.1 CoA-binding protein [Thermosipho ferrireducens]